MFCFGCVLYNKCPTPLLLPATGGRKMTDYKCLLPPTFREDVRSWLANDAPKLDWGGYVVGEATHLLLASSSGCVVRFLGLSWRIHAFYARTRSTHAFWP